MYICMHVNIYTNHPEALIKLFGMFGLALSASQNLDSQKM